MATHQLTEAERRRMMAGRGARPRGARNFEVFAWFWMRISGLFLIFLVLGHFLIMHILHDVRETNFDFVVARWGNPFWRVWDWLILALGLFHGLIGIRTVIEDSVSSKRAVLVWKCVLYSLIGLMFSVGTIIVFTFGSLVARG